MQNLLFGFVWLQTWLVKLLPVMGAMKGYRGSMGLCFVPPENVVMDDILLAVGEIIGVKNIRAAS